MDKYNLVFKGYFVESCISEIPHTSGVYIVYRCVYDSDDNSVTLKEPIYIGRAIDLNNQICEHNQKDLFESRCEAGETLCYSTAELDVSYIDVVENALVYMQQPPLNESLKEAFNYPTPVSFELEGRCSQLKQHYFQIINRNDYPQ